MPHPASRTLPSVFNVILYEPEIPQNAGNIIRLCANTGCCLHLVRPLGFAWDDRRLRRAGLDYREWADVRLHDGLEEALEATGGGIDRAWALTTRGSSSHNGPAFLPGDTFVFGPESRGLPPPVLARFPAERQLRIPMQPGSRSLNLANGVAVMVYEAWRQQGFAGAGS